MIKIDMLEPFGTEEKYKMAGVNPDYIIAYEHDRVGKGNTEIYIIRLFLEHKIIEAKGSPDLETALAGGK